MSKKDKNKGGKNEQDQAMVLSEAEKKALDKLDHNDLLHEISEQKNRIEELQKHVYDLNKEMRQQKEENLVLTLKMEKDLEERSEMLVQLQQEFDASKKIAEDKLNAIIEEKDKRLKNTLDAHNADQAEKQRRIDDLQAQVTKLSHFEEREEKYLARIEELENRYRQQEYVHNDQMKKMEKNFFKQNQNLESVNKAKIDDIMRNADKIAEKKVRDQEDKIKKENKKLKQELEVFQKELEQLKKEKSQISEDNKNVKKNFLITQDGATEYQNVNYQQAVKIKKLKEKVDYLKNFISEEVSKYTKEIELMKYQNQIKIQEYEYQIKSLKEQLGLKVRELKNVKALAQMILDQRSDIEQFFLQALDQVKSEIKKKNQLEKKNKLPDITQKSLNSQNASTGNLDEQKSKFYNEKIDISELDMEEKEKLLRILFSKMNQGVPASHWKIPGGETSFKDNHFSSQIKQEYY